MKRFEELKGRCLIEKLYAREHVDQIEYKLRLNNENQYTVNCSYMGLLNRFFWRRTLLAFYLNLTLWWIAVAMVAIVRSRINEKEPVPDSGMFSLVAPPVALLLVIASGFLYQIASTHAMKM